MVICKQVILPRQNSEKQGQIFFIDLLESDLKKQRASLLCWKGIAPLKNTEKVIILCILFSLVILFFLQNVSIFRTIQMPL